jgi:starch synthase
MTTPPSDPRHGTTDNPLRIVFASAEVAPFSKTGGLGEVGGALPVALAAHGHQVLVVTPFYRSAWKAGPFLQPLDITVDAWLGDQYIAARLWQSYLPHSKVPVILVEHEHFYQRDDAQAGHTFYQYRTPDGNMRDYEDNSLRFLFFSRAVLEAMRALEFWPDILHCNDWHTGFVPVYLRSIFAHDERYVRTRSLLTIHNCCYQGRFSKEDLKWTGLGWDFFKYELLEFHDELNFLKAGIVFADGINAVSRRYADEIQGPYEGYGLDPVLRARRQKLTGIMNGVDYRIWNPATDKYLACNYDRETLQDGKAVCKLALQREVRLPQRPDVPLLGMVSRLVEQKGFALIKGAAWDLLNHDVQLVVLGTGEPAFQDFLKSLAYTFPDKVAVSFEFNEAMAHRIVAGADMYLMPSRFEPSGLNQLYALKYGTVNIVRETGGLADSVADCTPERLAQGTATGFLFADYHPMALMWAIRRALSVFHGQREVWLQLQRNGMRQDWSQERCAEGYEAAYRKLVAGLPLGE